MNTPLDVARKITAKYFAMHDVLDTVEYSLAQVLALYGLLRLSEMDLGIDRAGDVDKKIANMLTSGAAQVLAYPHFEMGGSAGAYRFYQGSYKIGRPETSRLNQMVDLLDEQLCSGQGECPVTSETLLAVCPTLSIAAVVLQRPELHDTSIAWFENISRQIIDPITGLYRQKPSSQGGYGSYANGCAAAALVEILRYLPFTHPRRPHLIRKLQDFLSALLAQQSPDGLWRQSLLNPASYGETSGSALIAYTLFTALAQADWAQPGWQTAAEKAWEGLTGRVNLAGNINVSGVSTRAPAYMDRPEGLAFPSGLNELAGFGPLMMACAAYAWLERTQTWDSLVLPQRVFAPPAREAVQQYFDRVHATCEANLNPDGSYFQGTSGDPDVTFDEIIKESRTDHPIPRDTAHSVLGYLEMLAHDPQPAYSQRARAGLDWLVKEQEPDGCFRLWTRKKEGQVPHHGCLFETGIAAAALAKGYEFFQDERYLAASERAAAWELNWPVDRNVNYNAFVIWHLAEHYRLTRDEALLERTLYKTRQAMLIPQQAGGGWTGHNSWIWYHGINIRAYAALYGVLPDGHPFRPELRRALRASLQYACQLQTENGSIHPNPENLDKSSHLMFEIMVGFGTAARCLDESAIRTCLDGLAVYRISPESGDPDQLFNNEKGYWLFGCSPWYVYALGMYLNLTAR